MGQSPSSTSRMDNASTRTLHSSSINSNRNSNRPMSFFRRISHRISTSHPARRRRFGQGRSNNVQQQNVLNNTSASRNNSSNPINNNTTTTVHTSASSMTSSVRRATQEATRAAAAVTGPPNLPSFLLQHQQNANSSRNSIISADSASFWNELLGADSNNNNNNNNNSSTPTAVGGNSFLRYLRIPLRVQQEINASLDDPPPPPPPQSSASSTTTNTTARRMHILVIEYRTNNNNESSTTVNTQSVSLPPPPPPPTSQPPTYRFLGLRRPRSEVSTTSSTDTIQSMPLSMNSSMMSRPQQQQQQSEGGQWVVYVVNSSHAFQALSSSIEDNPSYEDLLWLSNMLGNVRPSTTTQAAVDEAIPVIDWSDDTKNQLKDDSCLVCLDEFALKQPVRILKCHHVFHRECVDRWLCEAHNSCPVCRGVPVESTPASP